jgi:flagellar hook-associated protein 1
MSGLSSALSSALSGLMVTSGQSAVVSKNITRANDENYVSKQVGLTTEVDGSVRIASITRNSEKRLLDAYLNASSSAAGQELILTALDTLQQTIGDVEADGSIAWGIGQLQLSLRNFETNPASPAMATQAIRAAGELVVSLNSATDLVQATRAEADAGMAQSVTHINALLGQIEGLNATIASAAAGNQQTPDALDQRDKLLKELAGEIGIRVVTQPNNGISIYSDSGVTLFDVTARAVAFQPTPSYSATTVGNAIYADGVQIIGTGSPMPTGTGKLAAYAQVRDQVAPTYQAQLDEIARGLMGMFAEADQSAVPVLPAALGLFTHAGGPAVPPAGTLIPGLAGALRLNAAFDPQQGGNPMLLRDGGANGAAYVHNVQGVSGYQQRLSALIGSFDATMTFAAASKLPPQASLKAFATHSAGWIEGLRAAADSKMELVDALQTRTRDALLRVTGVNLDEEMATMLELEKSFQASAKVMSLIDDLYAALFQAVN